MEEAFSANNLAQSVACLTFFFFAMQRVDKERVAGNRWMMRTGRGPTVAGTTTQYQPPFHRITQRRAIRLPRPAARTSAAFVRARLSSPLLFSLSSCRYTAFSRRRALTSVFSPPRAVVGRVVIVPEASPSRLSLRVVTPQLDFLREVWECIPRDLVECQ